MRKCLVLFIFVFILFGIVNSYPDEKRSRSLNLLVITLDTTRADCLGIYGSSDALTPHLDRIGKEGVVFNNCYAPVPLTLPSHCSIFTGRYPIAHGVRNNGTYHLKDKELTLAEIFHDRGYHTSAIISSFTLFSKFGISQGFNLYDEDFDSQNMILNFLSEIPAGRVYEKFSTWLNANSGDPFFLWLHFYDPHTPYLAHPDISQGFDHSNWMKYLGEIAYVDHYIGKVIQDLRSKHLLDNTLIIIAGDHGEAFGEHGEFGHGIFCYEEGLKVPLIFYHPQLFKGGRIVDSRVSLVDLMPTVLDIYDFDIPRSVQGKSLKRHLQGKQTKQSRVIYFESMDGKEKNNWAPLTGIIDKDLKYISLPLPELYDLGKDHLEKKNLFLEEKILARDLDRKLGAFIDKHTSPQASSRHEPSPDDLRRLQSLGYISAFSSGTGKMLDPKKGIPVYREIDKIKTEIKHGNYLDAEKRLDRLKTENPQIDLPVFYQSAFEIHSKTNRDSQAMSFLEKGLEKFPDNEDLLAQLAIFSYNMKKWQKTEEVCRRLLENNSLFTGAYVLLGDISENKKEFQKAASYYSTALEIEPQNELIRTKFILLLVKDGRFKNAKSYLQNLLENEESFSNPVQVEILTEIGVLLAGKNKVEDALSLLEAITKHSPLHHKAWLNLGTIYQNIGQTEKAIESFQKAIDLKPDYALASSHLGMAYLEISLKNKDADLRNRALDHLEKAIRIDPDIAEAYNGRAVVFLSLEKLEAAASDLKKAIELRTDYFEPYFNLCMVLIKTGRRDEALKYLYQYKNKYYDRIPKEKQEVLDRLISDLKR